MNTIYKFFALLLQNKYLFYQMENLIDFPFDSSILAFQNLEKFPHLVLHDEITNSNIELGGVIGLIDNPDGYEIPEFDFIPQGTISSDYLEFSKKHFGSTDKSTRQVYFLMRCRNRDYVKVCLIHGSFFETVEPEDLISQTLKQIFNNRQIELSDIQERESRKLLINLLSHPNENNLQTHTDVEGATINARFSIGVKVRDQANIMNGDYYPKITNNTINLIIPVRNKDNSQDLESYNKHVFLAQEQGSLKSFSLIHKVNGEFWVLQSRI